MTVLDLAGGYAVFANGGNRVDPYGIFEIRDMSGEVVYRHDRDEAAPRRIFPEEKAMEMNRMLASVNVAGTGRRALIEGVPTAGKTGTSQAYRDAWFIGYTGNYVTAVWFGNDDFRPTHRLTGGRLPAMTWQQFMGYAHNGIELKPIPGVGGIPTEAPPLVAEAGVAGEGAQTDASGRPLTLSRRSTEILYRLERMMRDAPPVTVPEPPVGPVSSVIFRGAPLEADPEEERVTAVPVRAPE